MSVPTGNEPTSVYLYYDKTALLLYVGITSRGIARQREHNSDKEWWPYVHHQEVKHFDTRRQAEIVEKDLIKRSHPPFNIRHNFGHAELRAAYLNMLQNDKGFTGPGALMQEMRGTCFIFPGRIDGHLSPAYISKEVSRALPPGVTCHKLRHRYATRAYRHSGHNLLALQRLMGHASPQTTAGYADVDDDELWLTALSAA